MEHKSETKVREPAAHSGGSPLLSAARWLRPAGILCACGNLVFLGKFETWQLPAAGQDVPLTGPAFPARTARRRAHGVAGVLHLVYHRPSWGYFDHGRSQKKLTRTATASPKTASIFTARMRQQQPAKRRVAGMPGLDRRVSSLQQLCWRPFGGSSSWSAFSTWGR